MELIGNVEWGKKGVEEGIKIDFKIFHLLNSHERDEEKYRGRHLDDHEEFYLGMLIWLAYLIRKDR